MHDVALVIDHVQPLRADFVGGDDVTAALDGADQSQPSGGAEQRDEEAVLALDAMQAGFELGQSWRVH